jgi:hypothetical protein
MNTDDPQAVTPHQIAFNRHLPCEVYGHDVDGTPYDISLHGYAGMLTVFRTVRGDAERFLALSNPREAHLLHG